MPTKLDRYDRQLLAALQENAQMPQSELGARVSLSTAAVNRRLRRLSQTGVIEGVSARVNPKALGYELSIVVEVSIEHDRSDLLDALRRRFSACPQVQQCYYVTGECDFVLMIVVRNMAQYVALARQFFHDDPNVKAYKTLVVMDRIKAGSAVPTEENPDGEPG